MTDLLIMTAALVAAIIWTIYLQRVVSRLTKRLASISRRLQVARMTLAEVRDEVDDCLEENQTLKDILTDVAKGEAHVWVGEDGFVRAARKPAGDIQIH